MSHVFVVNCGSSSIKWQILVPETGERIRGGLVERIGEEHGVADHAQAMSAILTELGDVDISAVGHRVVHGGTAFTGPVLVTEEVVRQISALSPLAPLHNPANLAGIAAARAALPDVPQVAVFDTAFHHSLPAAAYTYALDRTLAAEYGIRRFGFHGISYQHVARAAAIQLMRPLESLKLIVLHLGNGASACAIDGGRSVDTSMGMTPAEGLVMGTRSGDLDPGVLVYLLRQGLDSSAIDAVVNRSGGLKGLSGTGDLRDVEAASAAGDSDAELALSVMHHRLRHYVGAYLAVLGGADAIVFTGGIGEHSAATRGAALSGLEKLGIQLDADLNGENTTVISNPTSDVTVMVIPTNEEWEIALQTAELLGS